MHITSAIQTKQFTAFFPISSHFIWTKLILLFFFTISLVPKLWIKTLFDLEWDTLCLRLKKLIMTSYVNVVSIFVLQLPSEFASWYVNIGTSYINVFHYLVSSEYKQKYASMQELFIFSAQLAQSVTRFPFECRKWSSSDFDQYLGESYLLIGLEMDQGCDIVWPSLIYAVIKCSTSYTSRRTTKTKESFSDGWSKL